MLLLMAIDSSSAKTTHPILVSILSIQGGFLEITIFQDGFDYLRRFPRTPTGIRYRNGTGL